MVKERVLALQILHKKIVTKFETVITRPKTAFKYLDSLIPMNTSTTDNQKCGDKPLAADHDLL